MKIRTISSEVEQLLIHDKECRDNDNYLIARVWARHLKAVGHDTGELSAREFFRIYAYESILPHHESIRRARQKLQEMKPELRGETYGSRVTIDENETRQEIRKMTNEISSTADRRGDREGDK